MLIAPQVVYIWDISDLENPVNTGYHKATTRSIDHNLYVHDGLAYQSNVRVSGKGACPALRQIWKYSCLPVDSTALVSVY